MAGGARGRYKRERREAFDEAFGGKEALDSLTAAAPGLAPKAKPRRSLGGLRWTRRLKRFGGLRGLQGRRLDDLQTLANIPLNPNFDKHQRQIAKDLFEWMQENPLRVMPQAAREYFATDT